MTLAIMSALLDEQRGLLDELVNPRRVKRAGRTFWCGQWGGHEVVLVLSKVGKVAAATTTTALIEAFDVKRVVFTGVAGGIGAGVKVGDVVVARDFVQHDMNSSPLFARYEIPLYGCATLACDADLTAVLLQAVHAGLAVAGCAFSSRAVAGLTLRAQRADCQRRPLCVERRGCRRRVARAGGSGLCGPGG